MNADLGGGDSRSADPVAVLSTEESTPLDERIVVSGTIDIRKTHPNLYWLVMTLSIVNIALGLNFIINSPTFPIYNAPNILWGVIFLFLGFGKIIFLNFNRRLRLVRALMAFAVAYMMFLALGTMQPFLEGIGSLQLPILYAGLAAIQIPLLLEPFINPWTAKRDA